MDRDGVSGPAGDQPRDPDREPVMRALQRTASTVSHSIAEAWPTIAVGGLIVAILILA